MVTDERFFGFIKHLLHRIADLENEISAIVIVLRENYHEDFPSRVSAVCDRLEAEQAAKEYRECIDTLEIAEILDAFAKHKGIVQ